MLTYESLIDHAKLREMPKNKLRGILREYLQILILKEIYRTKEGRKLYFTGGTYLRLLENLKRFSEDLDFDTDTLNESSFEKLLVKVKNELERIGLKSNLENHSFNNIFSFKLAFPDIEKQYGISSKYSTEKGIIIKIEANKSKYKIKTESNVITGFGEFYPVLCTNKARTFTNKIDALIKKDRARHIYDFMFMLSKKYPLDLVLANKLGIKGDILGLAIKKIKSYSKTDLKKMATSFRPFLFDEEEYEKIINSYEISSLLIQRRFI